MNAYKFFDKFGPRLVPLYSKGAVRIAYLATTYVVFPEAGTDGSKAEDLLYMEVSRYLHAMAGPSYYTVHNINSLLEETFRNYEFLKIDAPVLDPFKPDPQILLHLTRIYS